MAQVLPLRVIVEARTYVFSQSEVAIGRATDADVVVDDNDVSRFHGILTREGDEWFYSDNASRNGSFQRGEQVDRLSVDRKLSLNLAGAAGPLITLEPAVDLVTGLAAVGDDVRRIISIGRAADNDLVVDDTGVSRYHAELLVNVDGTSEIIDLASRNGTLVNGTFEARAPLCEGDVLTFGSKAFEFVDGVLEPCESA